MLFGVVSLRFRAANQPFPYPPPPPTLRCILPSTLVAPNHYCFYFLNTICSLSPFSKYRHIHIFSQDSYTPHFPVVIYVTQPLLNPTQNFWSWLNPYRFLFVFCYNQLQHLLPCIFLFFCLCYPPLTIYPLKMTWNPWKHTSHIHVPMFDIFERTRSVPQQSEGPYLKETQPEWQPETSTGKRDPFSFNW